RLERAFAKAKADDRLAIVVYIMVGHPDRAATASLLRAAVDGGADVIELGVPFSDPLADGTTVQRAGEAGLHAGVTLRDCITEGASLVRDRDVPVLLMGYTNPFMQRGYERLADDLAAAGLSGVIIPDMPAEESAELDAAFTPRGLVRVDLYAPTTPDERLATLLPRARGFVYCVSLTGVTGARQALGGETRELVARIRAHAPVPIAVGFGIATPAHVRALRDVADGVVIGSAVLDVIANASPDTRARSLRTFVASLRDAGRRDTGAAGADAAPSASRS
ncbi:MAG TPA: tryptophan synthase subunit alpha, partial [Candidatus Limnocylindrales bacterium]|nr:tryptophan synthase subunit alpha [Candidatus Limnocylindrales bacterium]